MIHEIGTRCTSVRSVPCHAGYSYVAAGVYEVTQAKRGNYAYWKLVGKAGRDRRSSRVALADAKAYAEQHDIPVLPGVRHGSVARTLESAILELAG